MPNLPFVCFFFVILINFLCFIHCGALDETVMLSSLLVFFFLQKHYLNLVLVFSFWFKWLSFLILHTHGMMLGLRKMSRNGKFTGNLLETFWDCYSNISLICQCLKLTLQVCRFIVYNRSMLPCNICIFWSALHVVQPLWSWLWPQCFLHRHDNDTCLCFCCYCTSSPGI